MFLTIDEYGEIEQHQHFGDDWKQWLVAGVLTVVRFQDGLFEELDFDGNWIKVSE